MEKLNNILCCHGCGQLGIVKSFSRSKKEPIKFRCAKSSNSCPSVKEQKVKSCLQKYGVSNPFYVESIINDIRSTNLKKYGTTDPGNLPEFREAAKNTSITNWGTPYPSQSAEIQKKVQDTCILRFGVNNPQQNKLIQDKTHKTNLERYVNSFAIAAEQTRQKTLNTMQLRYGVDNPTQNPILLEKAHAHRIKKYTLPSGKIVNVQGYEPAVLDDLLKSGFTENEIIIDKRSVPVIWYEFENKKRRYFPDIFIPKYNLIIEVKSLYTWKADKYKNLAKINACKVAGYSINIAVR